MKDKKTLITTHTGESSQPVRIYYQVTNPKTVLGVFKKLRCVYFEKPLKRWRWIYEHEAKKLRFETSYSKIPKEAKPVVIGDFFWRGDQELLLEVRSFERAMKAINFFEKRINPRAAQANKIRVVNRFFAAEEPNFEELLASPYDHFFDGDEVYIPDPVKVLKEVQKVSENQSNEEDSRIAWNEYLAAKFKEKTPEIEEIPLDYYREREPGFSGLQIALALRTIEASQHFSGNNSFSQYDLIETITEDFMEIIQSQGDSPLLGIEESK